MSFQTFHADAHDDAVTPEVVQPFRIEDEIEPLPEPEEAPLTEDLRQFSAGIITLLKWANGDQARLAIMCFLLNQDSRSQAEIAREHRVSESRVSRSISEGREFLRKAQLAMRQQVSADACKTPQEA